MIKVAKDWGWFHWRFYGIGIKRSYWRRWSI